MQQTIEGAALPGNVSSTTWRLVVHRDMSAAYNMALDEALLNSVVRGGRPVVRFYTWKPTTLSLGTNQPLGEIDRAEVERRGFSLVRRMTGGRGVLHQHELTYSVVALENDPLVSGGVVESYRKISAALVSGLRALGAEVELAPPNPALHHALTEARRSTSGKDWPDGSHGAVCFDAASDYELTARGRKLVGSAQARRAGGLLQHGSILLDIDWDAWVNVFAYRSEAGKQRAAEKLPQRMTSLSDELGRGVTLDETLQAISDGFAETFGIELEQGSPSVEEETAAARLAEEKYASEAWTAKK